MNPPLLKSIEIEITANAFFNYFCIMENFLNTLEIQHFKSIKQMNLTPKRVNVFIGEPNVGKSNILEAISLLGASYSENYDKFFSEFIRYEEISNLFYDDDLSEPIKVSTDKDSAYLRYHTNNIDMADLTIGDSEFIKKVLSITDTNPYEIKNILGALNNNSLYCGIGKDGKKTQTFDSSYFFCPIKPFSFEERIDFSNKFPFYLLPPYGDNLFSIITQNIELRKEIASTFTHYRLNFVADKKTSKFEIQKNIDGFINRYNYSSIADTFKRLVFYFAAIDSNKDSVLILEEPEVHSFPPYTKELSDRIIASEENQFFITTHSPYMLQNLISNLDDTELNVYITYYEDYQTKVKQLTAEELRKASDLNMDLFFNLKNFIK